MLEHRYSWLVWSAGITVALVQPAAVAKSPAEVQAIARAITVQIDYAGRASGFLIQRQGEMYTVVTARHVADGVISEKKGSIVTADGKSHPIILKSIRRYQGKTDVAIVKFRSKETYQLAQVGNSNSMTKGQPLYISGFPQKTEGKFNFYDGTVLANLNKPQFRQALFSSNNGGPGMSGGPALNSNGEVAGIVVAGRENDDYIDPDAFYAISEPIDQFVSLATSLGVMLKSRTAQTAIISKELAADDYLMRFHFMFTARNSVVVDPKNDISNLLNLVNRAIEIDPQYAFAYFIRGSAKMAILDKLGTEKAKAFGINRLGVSQDYDKAIALNYTNTALYIERAKIKNTLQDFTGVLNDYNIIIERKPKNYSYRSLRAKLKIEKLKDYAGALTDYDELIALYPNVSGSYVLRGDLKRQKLDDAQGALTDYSKALTLDPNDMPTLIKRGWLQADRLNNLPAAEADFNKIIQLVQSRKLMEFVEMVDAYYNRSDFYYSQGAVTKAQSDLEQAVRSKPTLNEDPDNLNKLKLAQGTLATLKRQSAQAVRLLDAFIQRDTTNANAYKYRGIAHQQQGNTAAARADWQKAAQIYQTDQADTNYRLVTQWLAKQ
jgi:tetratricopeptide (TPR) repeat protein